MTETYNVSSRTGLRPNLKVALMSGIAAVALSGCSTWSSVLETVFGGPEKDGAAVIQTAGVTAVDEFPMSWEPAGQVPATWVSSQPAEPVAEFAIAEDLYAAEDDDDVMAQIADAAVLEGEAEDGVVQMADAGELSELRGGFVTRFGILSIGFDIKTFINGVLQVQNIFNLVGEIPDVGGADGNPATNDGPPVTPIQLVTVTSNPGGGAPTVTQSTPAPQPAVTPPTTTPTPTTTQQVTTPPQTPATTQQVTTPPQTPATTQQVTPQTVTTPPVTPQQVTTTPPVTTVTNLANGGTKIENTLNEGQTTVTNEVRDGAVQTIVNNTAPGIDINQVTSLSIGLADPSKFIGSVRSGVKTGNRDRLITGFRASLFGAISR